MTPIKCKNRQCGKVIAFVNGTVPDVKCECGTVRKLYHQQKKRSIHLTVKIG